MSTIKLIGRTTDFRGKTLWEIVGNLRNHGVGRVVQRNMFLRYPEPSFMKIMKVEALPNPTEVCKKKRIINRLVKYSLTHSNGGTSKTFFLKPPLPPRG